MFKDVDAQVIDNSKMKQCFKIKVTDLIIFIKKNTLKNTPKKKPNNNGIHQILSFVNAKIVQVISLFCNNHWVSFIICLGLCYLMTTVQILFLKIFINKYR